MADPVDGVGRTVKCAVWRRVLQKQCFVNSAKDFADVATVACPNTRFIYMSTDEVNAQRELQNRYWTKNPPNAIPGTRNIHFAKHNSVRVVSPFFEDIPMEFIYINLFQEKMSKNALSIEEPIKQNSSIVKGDFVVITYDKPYPGIIADICNDEVLVNALHPCRGGWQWPQEKDEIWYSVNTIKRKLIILSQLMIGKCSSRKKSSSIAVE